MFFPLNSIANTSTGLVTISSLNHWLGTGVTFVLTDEAIINPAGCPAADKYSMDPLKDTYAKSILLSAVVANKKVMLTIGSTCYVDRPKIEAVIIQEN